MSYSQTFIIKLLPEDTGYILFAKRYTPARVYIDDIVSGFTEIANGEYAWTYDFFSDNTSYTIDFYKSGIPDVYQTSTAVTADIYPIAVDVVSISGDTIAADNLETMLDGTGGSTLSLGQLQIVSSGTSNAVTIAAGNAGTSAAGVGVSITGGTSTTNNSGHGVIISGGAITGASDSSKTSGSALVLTGGTSSIGAATSGNGLKITSSSGGTMGAAGGSAVSIVSAAANGLDIRGLILGARIFGTGGGLLIDCAQGPAVDICGQSCGIKVAARAVAGTGISVVGGGLENDPNRSLGHGVSISSGNGATGTGVVIVSSASSSGAGIAITGAGSGTGMTITGGSTSGHGVVVQSSTSSGMGMHIRGADIGLLVDATAAVNVGTGKGGIAVDFCGQLMGLQIRSASGTAASLVGGRLGSATGNGLDISSNAVNGSGVTILGAGSGVGISTTGGSSGSGMTVTGVSSQGMIITGGATYTGLAIAGGGGALGGAGLSITGGNGSSAASGAAIFLTGGTGTGTTGGAGITITGGPSTTHAAGHGLLVTGGAVTVGTSLTSGDAVKLVAGASSGAGTPVGGAGLNITGTLAKPGISATGGATGDGVLITSGASGGNGLSISARGVVVADRGDAVSITASTATGAAGMRVTGSGDTSTAALYITNPTGTAVKLLSGTTSGNYSGLSITGSGSGAGVSIAGGATGNAITATSGTNASGMILTGNGTGKGLSVINGTNLDTLTTTGTTTLNALTVSNATTLSGAVSLGSTLGVTGATTLNGLTNNSTTTLTGAVSLGSTLGVTGTTTLAALTTTGTTTLNALTVSNATSLNTLTTSGTTTLNALTVSNATNLTGAVSLGSTLGVAGTTTLNALTVSNATSLNTLTTSGTTTLNALTVSNATTLSGAVSLGSTLGVVGTTTLGQLSLNGAFGVNGAVYINNTSGPGINTNGSTYGIKSTGTTTDIFFGTANLSLQDTVSDAVWDEILTGATHNVPTSSGRRLRNLGTWVAESGTAQGASSNYITLQNSASSSDHYYDEQLVVIIGGTLGVGQVRMIKEYIGSSRRAYVDSWTTTPTGTIEYELLAASFEAATIHGLIVSATANTAVIDGAASTTNDYYLGQQITISGGTGAGQARYIDGYDGSTKTLHVYTAWVTIPDTTSLYQLTPATGFRYTVGNINANTNTLIGTPIALDGGSATVSSMLTKMADDNNGLDFNSATDSLNKIQTFVSQAVPTGYVPTSATRVDGTDLGGTYTDLAAHDEVYMITGEDALNGLEVLVERSGSPIALTPSVLRIIGYYGNDPGHSILVNIYNYGTSSYDNIGQMITRADAFDYSFPMNSGNHNAITGEMKIQLVHDAMPFSIAGSLYLDQVVFEKLSDPSSMDSVLASIKSKTDQLNFILGDVMATLDGEVANANLVSIDGQLTSLNNAILNLKQLNIKSNGNLSAIDITGSGSGDALKLVGGATGVSINAGGDIDTSTIDQIQNGLALTTDVTTAVTNINAHTDVNLDAKVSTRAIPSDVTTAVTNINAHTDVNLDAKVSTRATPADVTTAVTNINAHTDSTVAAAVVELSDDITAAQDVILAALPIDSGDGTTEWTVTVTDGTYPLDGVTVLVGLTTSTDSIRWRAITDDHGIATFWLDGGLYYVWVQHAGYEASNPFEMIVIPSMFAAMSTEKPPVQNLNLSPSSGAKKQAPKLPMPSGDGTVEWTVTVDDGIKGIAGVTVMIGSTNNKNSIKWNAVTDLEGAAKFHLNKGVYYIWVKHTRYMGTNPSKMVID